MGIETVLFSERLEDERWTVAVRDKIGSPEALIAGPPYGLFRAIAELGPIFPEYEPLVRPRGLPSDVSREIRLLHEEYHDPRYTASWLSLREILDFDLSRPILREGYVDRESRSHSAPLREACPPRFLTKTIPVQSHSSPTGNSRYESVGSGFLL